MKTIYNDIIARLAATVPAIKWTDWNMGQLDTTERPAVMLPCALISIEIKSTKALTDTLQECKAGVRITLGFDGLDRTSGQVDTAVRATSLQVFDTIADVYKYLQGWNTSHFDALNRLTQKEKPAKNGTFQYYIEFETTFEDLTAEA